MMTKMMLSILISLMFLGGCATPSCSGIKNETKKRQCKEADQRYYNKTGWKYDQSLPIRDRY